MRFKANSTHSGIGQGIINFIIKHHLYFFSSGMIMSNITSSFLDHVAYKAVSGSLLIERSVNLKAREIVFSLQFLVITGFTLFTILLRDTTNHQLSTRPMWGAPLGLPFNDYGWFVIGPLFMSVVISLSLIYSIFI